MNPNNPGYSAPQAQRQIVMSAQFGKYMKNERAQCSSDGAYKANMHTLYQMSNADPDWHLQEGDIVYQQKETGRKRAKMDANNAGQQPWILSSVCGIDVPLDEWQRARGFTKIEKMRNCFKKYYQVVGVNLKTVFCKSDGTTQADDPVVLVGGVTHMLNRGPYPINPQDIVGWDLCDPDVQMQVDKTKKEGTTATMRKLVTVPLGRVNPLNSDRVLRWARSTFNIRPQDATDIATRLNTVLASTNPAQYNASVADLSRLVDPHYTVFVKSNECDEKDLVAANWKLQCQFSIPFMVLTIPDVNEQRRFTDIPDHPIRRALLIIALREFIVNTLTQVAFDEQAEATKQAEREEKERTLGKSIRGALPGERMDIMLFS